MLWLLGYISVEISKKLETEPSKQQISICSVDQAAITLGYVPRYSVRLSPNSYLDIYAIIKLGTILLS